MSNKLAAIDATYLQKLVGASKNIVITSHKSPDGDAIGSALAMYHILRNIGKSAVVILPDDVPEFLQWLDGYDKIVVFQNSSHEALKLIADAELIFSLDYNHLSRVGNEMENALRGAAAKFVLIDHHQLPESFAAVTYSDTSSSSTAEMIYQTIVACGWKEKINLPVAESIYTGIMTDSGSFRFPSVTAETHRIVGELIDLGLEHARIHRAIYDTNTLDRMRLVGYALSQKLEVLEDCATAVISLSLEELERFHHQPGDTESLVNQALSIKGVKLAAFYRETSDKIKISFRSKNSFDVNAFARESWNGGGHKNAAGGQTNESLVDALARFKKQCYAIKERIIES